MHELTEWTRLDRPYCSSDLFRQIVMDNVSASEAECRTSIREKIHKCTNEVCPKCVSPCNFPVARTVAQIFRCTDMTKHFGFLWYYQVSDAGQLARSMHGARRKDAYTAVPERLAAHRCPRLSRLRWAAVGQWRGSGRGWTVGALRTAGQRRLG